MHVTLLRRFVAPCVAVLLISAVLLTCFWFSPIGLPDLNRLKLYAPDHSGLVPSERSQQPVQAASFSELQRLFPVLRAAEGTGHYASLIARSLPWQSHDINVSHNLKELRSSMQIVRRYSLDEQMTILLNTAYFGDDTHGISAAEQHYFGVDVPQLDLPQSALLVGLLRSPSHDSPLRHPDRAEVRRNEVIAQMVRDGTLSTGQAASAQAAPLDVRAAR